jgi:hypothetical protein
VKPTLIVQKTAQLANALLARLLTVTDPANAGPMHGSAMPTVTVLLRTSVLTFAATTTTVAIALKNSALLLLARAAPETHALRNFPMSALPMAAHSSADPAKHSLVVASMNLVATPLQETAS